MAVDKLVDSAQLDADLTSVANAIRTKGETSASLAFPNGFVSAINAIPTGGGGSTELKMGVLRPDAELIQTYTDDSLVNADLGIEIPAYSTTAKSLRATTNLSPTITVDFANYDYFVLLRTLTIPIYSEGTALKGRQEYSMSSNLYELASTPANSFITLNGSAKKYTSRVNALSAAGAMPKHFYWSSTSAVTVYASIAYGAYQTPTAPALSGSTLTMKTPVIGIRGHTSYFTSAAWAILTDFRCQYVIDVYRAPKNNLNLDGWGTGQQTMHIIDCVNNNDGKLI